MTDTTSRWGDLHKRVSSAVVMALVGLGTIWAGGTVFAALVVVLTGLMIWELAQITAQQSPLQSKVIGVFAAICMALVLFLAQPLAALLLVAPGLALVVTARRDRVISMFYGIAILLAGYDMVNLRGKGIAALLLVVLIVIASDVAGYFAGRTLGGPKFWPAISPKKTWSGTVAGWLCAAIVATVFVAFNHVPVGVILFAPFLAFAGQLGDIMESWFKRRAGVKDSSNLIPGHGGFLDRFDAMIGAFVLMLALNVILGL